MKKITLKPASRFCVVIFLLCLYNSSYSQITYSNNYIASRTFVNISKPSGGTFSPNDTIEVRYTIYLTQSPQPSGGGGAAQIRNILKSARIVDTLPANVTYVANSLRILTNEGVLYKGPFTTAVDGDQGDTIINGANKIISIRARPSTGAALDTLHGGIWAYISGSWQYQNDNSIPEWSNSPLSMITYRVKVSAAYGQFITFNRSALWFKGTADAGPVAKYLFPRSVIAVYQSSGLCNNGVDLSETFETNGTFGSGKPQNRGIASTIVPGGGLGYNFVSNNSSSPLDGNYSVVNNSSALGSKDTSFNGLSNGIKVFSLWDVFGDHTGSGTSRYGNPPVDTAAAKPGGGYMLLVNASYATNSAISQTVNFVCKNTYYEFSAWFRNICPKCSGDSLSVGPSTAGYKTYPGNDSAGVRPNLSFEINDTLYYTSGDIIYAKNKVNPWIKKGFTFLNSLDSFKITIRNNSPGGGGNDWAIDDVSVSTCGPTLKMNYSPFVLGCSDTGPILVSLHDTVRYAYNNSYVYSKWQRSTNAGVTWTDIAGTAAGPAIPFLVNGEWQYVTNYTFLANGATDSGYRYRVIVATTFANLASNSCAFTDGSYTYLKLLKCGSTLITNLVSFNGTLINSSVKLSWVVTAEEGLHHYEIERSDDGNNFYKLSDISGQHLDRIMNYYFIDPTELNGTAYYSLKMVDNDGRFAYSKVIMLSTKTINFALKYVNNPFSNKLTIEYIVPIDGPVTMQLFDDHGRLMLGQTITARQGYNNTALQSLSGFATGMYILKISQRNNSISKKVVKLY